MNDDDDDDMMERERRTMGKIVGDGADGWSDVEMGGMRGGRDARRKGGGEGGRERGDEETGWNEEEGDG